MDMTQFIEIIKALLLKIFAAFEVDKEFEAIGIDIYELLAPKTEVE